MSTAPQFLKPIKTRATILGAILALMWMIEVLNFMLGGKLDQFGVQPRELTGLRGIILGPLLHADFSHLIANSLPFLILGWLVMLRRVRDFFIVTPIVMVVAGLGTWLTGAAHSVHIGASGVVFGYLGFLLARGYFERSLLSIAVSLTIGFVYGSLIWGVLPGQVGISWQGHFFGFIGGVLAARLLPATQSS